MKEELIERFFKKQCTAEEAIQVAEYLKNNPSVLDKYLSAEEWENIEPGLTVPEEFWDEIWAGIQKKKKKKAVILRTKKVAVAACAAGLLVIGYHEFAVSKKDNENVLSKKASLENTVAKAEHKTVINSSKKIMHIILEDSSIIDLSPASVVQYDMPFQNNKREVSLEGEAYFKITKDKTKPFTVYAGGLATTALGTEFKITTKSGVKNNVTVKLYTGKVVIKSINSNLKGWDKDIYLQSEEQMQYDADKMLVALSKMKNNDFLSEKIKVTISNKKKATIADDKLSFKNSSLPDVMEKLARYYNVKIKYDKTSIETMNFTGTISRNDSLSIVLKIIAQMNNLEISRQGDGFLIQNVNKK